MFNSLLSAAQWSTYIILGVLVVAIIVMFVFSSKRRKKQEEDAKNLIDSVKPGNKVKTIGGICGIVVEVDTEENTFVLETGTEQSGKSYIKFDRQAIYQTDAVVDKNAPAATPAEDEAKPDAAEEVKTEAPEEPFTDEAITPATEEVKQEEVKAEAPATEKTEKKPAKKKTTKKN